MFNLINNERTVCKYLTLCHLKQLFSEFLTSFVKINIYTPTYIVTQTCKLYFFPLAIEFI